MAKVTGPAPDLTPQTRGPANLFSHPLTQAGCLICDKKLIRGFKDMSEYASETSDARAKNVVKCEHVA